MLVNRNKEHDGSMQKRTADKTAVRFYSCRPYTLQLRFGRSRRAALRVRGRALAADDARGADAAEQQRAFPVLTHDSHVTLTHIDLQRRAVLVLQAQRVLRVAFFPCVYH